MIDDNKIRFVHFRLYDPYFGHIEGKGGMTYAYRKNPHGDGVQYAFSACSYKDNYNKQIGRQLAAERLILEQEGKVHVKEGDDLRSFADNLTQFIVASAFNDGAFIQRKFSRKARSKTFDDVPF